MDCLLGTVYLLQEVIQSHLQVVIRICLTAFSCSLDFLVSGGGVSYIKVEVRMLPTTHRQIEGLRTDTKLSFNLLLYLHILHFAAPKGLHGIQSNIRYSTERQSLTPFNSNGTLFLGSGYYFNIGFCCKFNHS